MARERRQFQDNDEEAAREASWREIGEACCAHSLQEWPSIVLGIIGIGFFLFFFVVGLDILTNATKVIGGCNAGLLFSDDTNPVSNVMIGVLASSLLASSSATTSITVSLIGAGAISVRASIFIIMGSNVGVSVVSTVVSLGHMGNAKELERAFAGATVHDMFNLMTLLVLFPIEVTTWYIYNFSLFLIGDDSDRQGSGERWTSPLKEAIEPISKMIIIPNKRVPRDIAKGFSCDDFYPVNCTDGILSYRTCRKVGLIRCDKKFGCPAFFQDGASRKDDETAGAVCFVLGLAIIFICSIIIITILQRMLMRVTSSALQRVVNVEGSLAILIGAGATVFVQSSTVFTSALLPFVGSGAIRLEEMFPLTVGANIGTTFVGILASLVSDGIYPLQASLCQMIFNVTGAIIWYLFPFMRRFPLNAARMLGAAAHGSRLFPIFYIIGMFGVLPRMLLFVSDIVFQFDGDARKYTIFGAFIAVVVILLVLQPRGSESDSQSYQQVLQFDNLEVLPPPTTETGSLEEQDNDNAFAEVVSGQGKESMSMPSSETTSASSTLTLPVQTSGIRLVGVTLE